VPFLIPSPRRRGFTLIELLIVVAIIAILAAIAVPNFLEAQVRSKVSRAKSDMRTLTTAIETYRIDHNIYPIAAQWVAVYNRFNARMLQLTTPISYISSLPEDIFRTKDITSPVTIGEIPTYEYTDFSTAINLVPDPHPTLPSYNLFQNQEAFDLYYSGRSNSNVMWNLLTVGPDEKSDYQQYSGAVPAAQAYNLGLIRTYDPTNGTTSVGDIARTNQAQRN